MFVGADDPLVQDAIRMQGKLAEIDARIVDEWAVVQQEKRRAPMQWRHMQPRQWPNAFREAWEVLDSTLEERHALKGELDRKLGLRNDQDE